VSIELITLFGLASWRLTRVLPKDVVAERLRNVLTLWAFSPNATSSRQTLFYLLMCPLCLSLYVSAAVVVLYQTFIGVMNLSVFWQIAATWAVASIIALMVDDATVD
jgi:hypothetical protein